LPTTLDIPPISLLLGTSPCTASANSDEERDESPSYDSEDLEEEIEEDFDKDELADFDKDELAEDEDMNEDNEEFDQE